MQTLKDWERKYYSPGGGDPFLLYAIFGKIQQPFSLSRSKYRTEGVPKDIRVESYQRETMQEAMDFFVHDYLGDVLKNLDQQVYDQVTTAPQMLLLKGTISDPSDLNYLRDVVGFVFALLEQGGIAVCDPQTFSWWTLADWQERLFDPDGAVPRHHVVILLTAQTDNPSLTWVHTRGMRKFGRPDLNVRNVPKERLDLVIEMCSRFIEHQAFGLIVPDGQQIAVKDLPDGMTVHHAGDLDDPEFNNVHLEIRFP